MLSERFPERGSQEVQQATLCFLIDGDRILLAMKKRGFGVGLWNGVGGKVHPGESMPMAVRREASEEIEIHIVEAEKVALLHFYFPDDPRKKDWNQDVHVFLVKKWLGKPKESEEMKPSWFKIDDLPYQEMWADDPLWLSRVLVGGRLRLGLALMKTIKF